MQDNKSSFYFTGPSSILYPKSFYYRDDYPSIKKGWILQNHNRTIITCKWPRISPFYFCILYIDSVANNSREIILYVELRVNVLNIRHRISSCLIVEVSTKFLRDHIYNVEFCNIFLLSFKFYNTESSWKL